MIRLGALHRCHPLFFRHARLLHHTRAADASHGRRHATALGVSRRRTHDQDATRGSSEEGGEGTSSCAAHVAQEIFMTSSSSSSAFPVVDRTDSRTTGPASVSASAESPPPAKTIAKAASSPAKSEPKAGSASAPWTATRVEALLAKYAHLFGTEPQPRQQLSVAAREEVRELIDYVTQTLTQHRERQMLVTPQQRQWVGATCRLAYAVGFHNRCCELFFSSLEAKPASAAAFTDSIAMGGEPAAGVWPKVTDGVPEYVIEAAAAADDLRFLERCFTLSRDTHAACCASPPADKRLWCATAGAMQGLRVYCGCVRLFNDRGGGDGTTTTTTTTTTPKTAAAVGELGSRIGAWLRLTPSGTEKDDGEVFFKASVRLAKYASKRHFPKSSNSIKGHAYSLEEDEETVRVRAAVFLQVFQHWCRTQTGGSASTWLTAKCLHALLRSATQAQRWDAAALYATYVEVYLGALHSLDHGADDALIGTALRFYLFSHQARRGAAWLARVHESFPDYLPSVATGSVMARVVGAAADTSGGGPALALWCLEVFLSSSQPAPPTPVELFDCVCALARSGLPNFTAIVDSLAENGLLTVSPEEQLYVRLLHCRGNVRWRGLLEALLQESLGPAVELADNDLAATPPAQAHHTFVLEAPSATASPERVHRVLSPRNAYTILLVMQEGEHPSFLAYYRFFLLRVASQTTTAERARWAMFATVWATARAGRLDPEDALFVAREVSQLLHPAAASSSSPAPVIPAAVRRSLESKWAVLYGQYSPTWWSRLDQGCGQHRPQRGKANGRCGPALVSSPAARRPPVVAPAPATEAAFPVARFMKKRSLLRLSTAPADLFASTTWAIRVRGSATTCLPHSADSRHVWSGLLSSRMKE